MAKLSKKGISTLLVLLVVVSLLSLTMFSCTIRMAQKDSTYIDMGKAHLLQLETPADDAPAMIVHTSVGDITAVLYPEVAPNYVAQFTELVEKGYYDGTYVYQTEPTESRNRNLCGFVAVSGGILCTGDRERQ